jgi:hypothetical protein
LARHDSRVALELAANTLDLGVDALPPLVGDTLRHPARLVDDLRFEASGFRAGPFALFGGCALHARQFMFVLLQQLGCAHLEFARLLPLALGAPTTLSLIPS